MLERASLREQILPNDDVDDVQLESLARAYGHDYGHTHTLGSRCWYFGFCLQYLVGLVGGATLAASDG